MKSLQLSNLILLIFILIVALCILSLASMTLQETCGVSLVDILKGVFE